MLPRQLCESVNTVTRAPSAKRADQWPTGTSSRRPLSLSRFTIAPSVSRRSEEHTSELQSLMRISYAVFCLKKKNTTKKTNNTQQAHKYRTNHKSNKNIR